MLLLIMLVSFLILMTLFMMIYQHYSSSKIDPKKRIDQYIHQAAPAKVSNPKNTDEQLSGLRGLIRNMSKYLEWAKLSKSIPHKLVQAGLPIRGSEFMVICLGTASFGAVILLILSGSFLWTFVGGASGYLAPIFGLRILISRRAKAFNHMLGDALTLISNSLRTGYSFMQAIEMVSREMPPPISVEFARVLKEMSLGLTTEDAMNNLAKRVDSNDLDLVVTAVLIQRQIGGNLAEVLDNIANTIRQRISLRGEIKTLTAQGKVSGIIIGSLPFFLGIVIYIMNPEYVKILFSEPIGKLMVLIGLVSQMIGIYMVKRIVNIDL